MSPPTVKWSGRINREGEEGATRFGGQFKSPELPYRSIVLAQANTSHKRRPSATLEIIAVIFDLLSLW